MGDNEVIAKLVAALTHFKPGAPLKNYIAYAVFPKFKNLEEGTRIDFNFPLTALVGPNGIGKSSVLHALWGMPYKYSTSKFWFETALDPIGHPQTYFYGHWSDSFGGLVETRKARVGAKRDYWEPARPRLSDGMLPIPPGKYEGKALDRWHPVRREVRYINLKAVFGSFDRYFYFDDDRSGGDRREAMLREALRLKSVKDRNLQSYKLGRGQERLFENRDLTKNELESVSKILGRNYDSARIIRHSLYPGNRGRDLSVVFRRGSEYSEAFAGSGEIAAVSAVVEILKAKDYSLILLDEPETSLHPGAQRALLRFLLEQIQEKNHQIVMSTHSDEFIKNLPHDAIKVFEENGQFRSRILPRSSPDAALLRLGKLPENVRRVLVEDPVAAALVLHAAKSLDHGDAAALEVRVAPGGAESILTYMGPSAMVSGDNIFFMLDGDKRKVDSFSDPDMIPPAKHNDLEDLIKKEIGCKPRYQIPGGDDKHGHSNAKVTAQLNYLRWLRKRVSYLPRLVPEHVLLAAMEPKGGHEDKTAKQAKVALKGLLTKGSKFEPSGDELRALIKIEIGKIPFDNADIVVIRDQLQRWLHG
ncbi:MULTISPECIES: ATP-dependent nuclease [Ralstonia]|jgi:AAA ATPase domain/AAA domain|uniref:ATPase AAA-type core domain-containing protein n=2 Tax=Ralstonia pickettii TaxID=329 RepID=A0ABM9IQW8_RALPI|nr:MULTISPECIES: ATP-binding protein [Ralstonia]MBA4200895.1 hypothetical protein [Ralstonia sp.]MBA4230697.1 hypothetical protein [Ralstonia sp.]MBA4237674.1 hypothetical protein [Ralstonia sp.]MBA4402430.1 hypothetical protein [Ralstonia sp.]POH87638.1 hypothetical protein CJ026_012460 [Ralstonia pickettii]